MKNQIEEILEAFLPAMAKIQDMDAPDTEKKRAAKEWLRVQLNKLLNAKPPK